MTIDAVGAPGLNRYALLQEQNARQLAAVQTAAAKPKTQPFEVVPQQAQAAGGAAGPRNGPAVQPPAKPVVWLAAPIGRDAAPPGQGAGTPALVQDEPRFIGPVVPRTAEAPDGRPSSAALDPFRQVPPYVPAPGGSASWSTGDAGRCPVSPAAVEEQPQGNRWMSALEAVGGVAETIGGVALTATGAGLSEFGIGVPVAALGIMVTADGAQRTVHGLSDTLQNESTPGYITQGLTGAGMDPQTASRIDTGVGVAGALAGGGSGAVKAMVVGGSSVVRLGGAASAALTVDGAAPGAYYAATGDQPWTPGAIQGLTATGLSETQANYALTIGGLGIGAGGHLAGSRGGAAPEPARVPASPAMPVRTGPWFDGIPTAVRPRGGDGPGSHPRVSEVIQQQDGGTGRRVEVIPRDEALGPRSSMSELLANPLRPGREGVILADDEIRMGDIYKLSEATGVEYALAVEWVDGRNVFKLYSGTAWKSGVPSHGTHVAHTHPNPNEHQQYPSRADMESATNSLDRMRAHNDGIEAPEQYIVWGPGDTDYTGYYGGPFKTGY